MTRGTRHPRVSDAVLMATSRALPKADPAAEGDAVPHLLPPLNDARAVSRYIAIKVGLAVMADELFPPSTEEEITARVDATIWEQAYAPMSRHSRLCATPSAAAKIRFCFFVRMTAWLARAPAAVLAFSGASAASAADPIPVKAMIVSMLKPEGEIWLEHLPLKPAIPVPGLSPDHSDIPLRPMASAC